MIPDPSAVRADADGGLAFGGTSPQEGCGVGLQDLLRTPPRVAQSGATPRSKDLGAYYTDAAIASFLVRWAVVTGREIVLDPGSGEGAFLISAAERIRQLGGDPSRQVYGVEVDEIALRRFAAHTVGQLPMAGLVHANFFDIDVGALPPADAVVGNPPFIRYQKFNGDVRRAALSRAREAGVQLSGLTSSWAPFLIHATRFVRRGGRFAMVVPAELAHAGYARPVLEYLRSAFRKSRILSFSRRLFPRLSEDTVLLLAEGRGEPFESLELVDLPGPAALVGFDDPAVQLPKGIEVDALSVQQGSERLAHYLVPERVRALYAELRRSPDVVTLGDLASVGIGYVTGDNDFFHLSKHVIDVYGVPQRFLRPAVRSGSELVGLRFTRDDWETLHLAGHANSLLHIPDEQPLPPSVQAYLLQGVRRGVPSRYKCRVRKPWYSVPQVYESEAFLTYMSGTDPKLVANDASAVAPNTLHIVQLRLGSRLGIAGLVAAWLTSLTAFSCELEGHSLGGGMLKLEPGEARKVAIAFPRTVAQGLGELCCELDGLLRAGRAEAARERADAVVLQRGLGLSKTDVRALRDGWCLLRARRLNR